MVSALARQLVDQENSAREELTLAPMEQFRIPPEDETEEQRADFKRKEIERKNEALKKVKKKPKTDEEEVAEMETLINKLTENLSHYFINNQVDAAQKEIEILKTKWLMENHLVMDREMWAKLNRKVSLLDIDLGEQDLVMLADYEHLPYAKINPVLLAEKVGLKQIEADDIVPTYVYVMECLNLEAEDFAQAEA